MPQENSSSKSGLQNALAIKPGSLKSMVPDRWRTDGSVIPVVRLQGTIMATTTQLRQNLSMATVAPLLARAFSHKYAPAVAIAINSPGGSPVQSRLIYKRIRDLAKEKDKKVLVFVEDVAASGGYMIACAGDEIFADPSSIVGSIGVISAGFGFTEMIEKIGVKRRVYKSGANKAMLDPFLPEDEDDVAHLKDLQRQVHDVFIDLVKDRRGKKLNESDDLFTGQFWTGKRGLELGLVDGIGDVREILHGRFGKDVKLKLIEPSRGILGRRIRGLKIAAEPGDLAASAASAIFDVLEERALWSRFGL